jgi:ribosomal subunit interface protein
MDVSVGGRNMHLTPRLHDAAQRKLDRFERFAPNALRAEVIFGESSNTAAGKRLGGRHDCTVWLHLPHEVLQAHAHGETSVAALDGALAKVRHQVERVKDLRVGRRGGARRGSRRARTRS